MSRMNQVMQIGNIEGDIHYYIEDYAYTYLKKQKGREKAKYFLYGEREENNQKKKIYIYGIAEKPKMEQTYFKEYYPLGFLKIKNDETFWVTLKGQEQKVSGFYVFYAPNQAMQEYLVDHREEEKTDKPEDKAKRQLDREILPMKETLIPARKIKKQKKKGEFKNEKFIFPVGGIIVASLILAVLSTSNGQKKIEIFKQVIAETMSGAVKESTEEDYIIEEKSVNQGEVNEENDLSKENVQISKEESVGENNIKQENNPTQENEENNGTDIETAEQEKAKEDKAEISETASTETEQKETESVTEKEEIKETESVTEKKEIKETAAADIEDSYEEYVVKNGDTLVAICKTKYGSLTKMKEICTINNIKNADYIAPGQKIYLP